MDDIEDDALMEAREENKNFLEAFRKHVDVYDFLARDKKIYARGTTVEAMDQRVFLNFSSDLDGCVVELSKWNGVLLPVKHLTVFNNNRVRLVKSMLKKHVNLTRYKDHQMSLFNQCLGFQLFYERGWDAWLALIPSVDCRRSDMRKEQIQDISVAYFKTLREHFRRRLMSVSQRIRRTLVKNDLSDLSKIFVLPDDSAVIMHEFQCAVDATQVDERFQVISFCFRFGEKASDGVCVSDFDSKYIRKITVHCAMNISSDVMDLMWSVAGVQSVIGNRGVLSTCLSFGDCACFQSNVDSRMMDVKEELRKLCRHPENVRFVQMYADTPHRRPATRFHPVSGSIAVGMVYQQKSAAAFERDAIKYISTLKNNFELLQRGECRVEFVAEVFDFDKSTIACSDLFDMGHLRTLLESKPMLAPFPLGTVLSVKKVGLWISEHLKYCFETYSRTCNVEYVWKAFQLEVAAEKLLWGHPLCFQSHRYSVNLGPGQLTPSRSRTDENGFLSFDRWSACMASEDSLPACGIWGATQSLESMIRRTAGIHDVINSAPHVLGRRIVHALIEDLFVSSKVGTVTTLDDFKRDLFSDTAIRLRVFGTVTRKRLSSLISKERRVPNSMVFGAIRKMMEKSRYGLSEILEAGLQEVRMKNFPAIQLYNRQGNETLHWNWRNGLWKLVDTEPVPVSTMVSPDLLTSMVTAELELRQLVHVSRLKSGSCKCFPWMPACDRKLAKENLEDNELVAVMCFISCIGLMMNGWYVDYNNIVKLLHDLPKRHPQAWLKDLEILSKLLLSDKFNKFPLYRLHNSIPTELKFESPKGTSHEPGESNPEDVQVDVEHPQHISEADENQCVNVICRQPLCAAIVPGEKRKWTGEELELLHEIATEKANGNVQNLSYDEYKRQCLARCIPFRTKRAYTCKLSRL